MRLYTLAEGRAIIPPWCLSLRCVGSCFSYDEYIPVGDIVPQKLELPPTRPGVCTYYPLVLKNEGDTLMRFNIGDENENSYPNSAWKFFDSQPRIGCVFPKSHTILLVRFNPLPPESSPLEYETPSLPKYVSDYFDHFLDQIITVPLNQGLNNYSHTLVVVPNGISNKQYQTLFKATVHHVGLEFLGIGNQTFYSSNILGKKQLVFRATSVGSVSEKRFFVRNPGRKKVNVQIKIIKQKKTSEGQKEEGFDTLLKKKFMF
jgi:hypothetical protein